jgi:hypothetical protein
VATNLGSNSRGVVRWVFDWLAPLFALSPEQGARTTLHVATSPALAGVSGRYFASSREARTSRAARDDAAAARLWALSEELCGVAAPLVSA